MSRPLPILFTMTLLPLWGWFVALLFPAVGLFLLRQLPRRAPQWAGSDSGSMPKRSPSMAHLVWPVALLPPSGWLTYFVSRCPGNPGTGMPIAWAVGTYLAPPLLLAAFILILRWRPGHAYLRPVVAVGLVGGFLAACAWGW